MNEPEAPRIRLALVSVSDKRGLDGLARVLARHGVQILSTGGTARALRDAGASVKEVAEHTGAPEILDGRVKTLHPRIHGGILGRPTEAHRAEMARHGIEPIDHVVVNLYPFAETVARPLVTDEEAIENIDIGGPAMIRSAAKNHERVAVVVDPADYDAIASEMDANGGALSLPTRRRLAAKAYAHTAGYDAGIARWFAGGEELPESLVLRLAGRRALRYGENPHQRAALYLDPAAPAGPSVARAEVLQGKELSYNNLLDLDAALALVGELAGPAAVIVKHNNPCGVAESGADLAAAYLAARACDPVSAFGGVVAVNRPVDDALACVLGETFLECVIAPGFSDGARAELMKKKNLRLLVTRGEGSAPSLTLRSIAGGVLVQTRDAAIVSAREAKVVTKRAPTENELCALDFGWRVAKHVRSNAIVLARSDGHHSITVGVGAGQMSRVDSVRLAVEKARLAGGKTDLSVMASDAFFPFRDGVDAAAAAGVTAVIQPGGSVRDEEVIAAADEHGMAMILTQMRHFRH